MKIRRTRLLLAFLSISSLLFSCGQSGDAQEAKGLDVILGEEGKSKPQAIICSEDAYVRNGISSGNDDINTNYGHAQELELKGHSDSNTNERIIFLKFDLSDLKSRTISFASLGLYCYSAENNDETTINVYGASAQFWSENNITYSNMPNLGSLVTSKKQNGSGYISFDLTSFLKPFIARGNNLVSFAIKNEPDSSLGEGNRRFSIRSKESSSNAEKPRLDFSFGKASFTTDLKVKSGEINPWSYAMNEVESFLERKDQIFQNETRIREICAVNEEEYIVNVDAAKASQTDGDNTQYTSYPTRTMDTLIGFDSGDEVTKYDKYGGLIEDNNTFNKTGFFHSEMKDNRAYLVDPLGNKFYRVALNAISSADSQITNMLIKKYGDLPSYFEYESNHLKNDLGFNSAGAWSNSSNLRNTTSNLAMSDIVYFASEYGKLVGLNNTTGGSTTFVNGVMPVFDPNFVSFSNKRAEEVVKPFKDDEKIFGWFLDNELEASKNMLDNFLRVDYDDERNNYSYAIAYTYLYKKINKTLILASDINDELRNEFRAFVYERYYRITTSAIRAVDDNHMIIGCRFLRNCYQDEKVMNVAGYYGDLVSFNYYNTWTADADLMNNIYKYSKKPFIVTEWYAKGMDACTPETRLTNLSGAGWTVRTQLDRGKFYQNYALRLMEAPYCVGFDYFKMWDNNPNDTSADTSNTNSNKGIYNIKHEEYVDLTNQMKQLNNNKYSLLGFLNKR